MSSDPFLHQLLTAPAILNALLSPDGRWAAFTWYRVHENVDVFVVPTDGSAPPVALTRTPEYTHLVSWTSDSRAVLVEDDHDGDERYSLFRVDIGCPGEMIPLTEGRPEFFTRGGSLSPDGACLYYGANYDFSLGCEIESTWVYRHHLASGERRPIARPAQANYMEVSLNLPGTHLLYSRRDRHPAGRQFYLLDVEGKLDREILNFGDRVKVFARWFPDGENILVLSEATSPRPQQHKSLGVYHWPSGGLRWLVDDPDRQLENAWVSPDGMIMVDEIRSAVHTPSWIDPTTGAETAFPHLQGNLLPLGRSADGAWIAQYYSATQPAELVRFSAMPTSPQNLISLTHTGERTALRSEMLAPAEATHWRSPDGLEIHGWLYRAQPNPHRAVLYLHGGPTSHTEDKLNPLIQYLIWRGFNVLDVNYRGSTGFGLQYREAIKIDGWGGREQADIAAGARHLQELGLADPGRVGVTGTSYGGYSAWCQITHYPPEVIGAAAPVCGITDLVVDYHTTRPDLRPLSEEMIGGKPEDNPQRYYERSPINFVQDVRGKLLIVQGAKDPNVSPENVRQVVKRLEQHGIPYELLSFEDEGHGIVKPANQELLYARLAEFFARALG